ncbi:Alg9-like mannosyltransferase family-domain-containing protein [Lactifluus volemus]|nr:Alg9-like mannosyltransferase family-domain-containing protein [Lactifluus volemus]
MTVLYSEESWTRNKPRVYLHHVIQDCGLGLGRALALAVRVVIALITRTFFQPDEYFQALEPAHFLVFGYGDLTWEWTSNSPIRSIFYPFLNVPIYWLLKTFRLDGTFLLVVAPKVLHGLLASGTDIWARELSQKTSFFLSLTSVFHVLSLSRSISNSLETTFTTIALCYYPWDTSVLPSRSQLRKFLIFAALACSVRVTSAITWAFLIPPLLWQLSRNSTLLRAFITEAISIASLALCLLFTLDSIYYSRPTLTPLTFLRVNASSTSLFYGTAAWHYYLSQALPLLVGPALPFVLHGAYLAFTQGTRPLKLLLYTVVWTTAEWRFLHPLVPVTHLLAARSLCRYMTARRSHFMSLALLSLPPALYVARWHSFAQISVLSHLRRLPDTELRSIGFLMPCHSTPAQSHLHLPIPVWRLTCDPPLHGEDLSTHQDETDAFFKNPAEFLSVRFPDHVDPTFPPSIDAPQRYEWPSHVVLFGALLRGPGVEDFLRDKGYTEVWHAGNGIEEDPRRRGGVRIWQWQALNVLGE